MQETQETWIQPLGWEDPLKKGMVAHSGILAWEITWTEEPGGLQSIGSERVKHDLATECTWVCVRTHTHTHTRDYNISQPENSYIY